MRKKKDRKNSLNFFISYAVPLESFSAVLDSDYKLKTLCYFFFNMFKLNKNTYMYINMVNYFIGLN